MSLAKDGTPETLHRADLRRLGAGAARLRSKETLRLWLRLIACENIIEHELRGRMREKFSVTLPQFDVLAELEHVGRPINMTELSKQLMVSNGNVTGLVDRLVREGLVERSRCTLDRRAQLIALTEKGLALFREIAEAHETWVSELFADLKGSDVEHLVSLLGKAHGHLRKRTTVS